MNINIGEAYLGKEIKEKHEFNVEGTAMIMWLNGII